MRIVIVRHDNFTLALEYILKENDSWNVSGIDDITQIQGLNNGAPPDVLILDILDSTTETLDTISTIQSLYPAIKIVLFTGLEDVQFVQTCLNKGVHGYILKHGSFHVKQEMIKQIFEGGLAISPALMRKIVTNYLTNRYMTPLHEKLTRRENDVMNLVIEGHSYKTIADALHLSIETIRHHIRNIYGKLNVNSKSELIKKVLV